jgi:2-C-methyl-D-erythritol 4-phosphate cytidylyltransferase
MAAKMLNTAIIVAAGAGKRFGDERPKQFVELLGKPLIIHTIEPFESCPAIDEIVLVAAEDRIEELRGLLAGMPFDKVKSIVAGGATRAESVRNGLDAIDGETAWIVAVHDGARPLVTAREITQTVEAASLHGAACLVTDLTDTIKKVDHGFITDTVPRADLRRALTPQAFQYDILRKAFDEAELGDDVTDECCLVERAGIRIFCIEGSSRNIKITRPEDLKLAEMYLSDILAADKHG